MAKKRRAKGGGRSAPGHGEIAREVAGFLVLGAVLFALVSLWTLDLTRESPLRPNAGGPAGDALARALVSFLGWLGAYALVLSAGAAGIVVFFRLRVRGLLRRAVALAVLVVALAILEALVADEGPPYKSTAPRGGWVGQALEEGLVRNANRFGAYLAVGVGLTASILVAGNLLVSRNVRRARQGLVLAGRGGAVLARWAGRLRIRRRAVPPPRSPRRPDRRRRRVREEPSLAEILEAEGPRSETLEEGEVLEERALKEGAAGTAEPAQRRRWKRKLKIRVKPEAGIRKGPAASRPVVRRRGDYRLPSLTFLEEPEAPAAAEDREEFERTAAKIEETLRSFKIDADVVEIQRGPVVTQYELGLAAGTKVHKITNLSSELAMTLRARRIRIVAPIPGKATVGVEVPNRHRRVVRLRDVFESRAYRAFHGEIPLLLGKDVAGEPIVHDLTDMPHVLIAGATGSGKSVCLSSIITSILMTKVPDEVKLILMDPKMVELSSFEGIPHLLCPVVTDMKKAPAVLEWAVRKMDERYELLAAARVRNIVGYNALDPEARRKRMEKRLGEEGAGKAPPHIPYIVFLVDELADLMMTASKEVEGSIIRLAQKSRAVGIHCVLATQRPSVDVITGLIKSNMPCRISFHVSSKVDSRTILDRNGAETLLGRGDMLYVAPGTSELRRAQSAYVSEGEIRDIVRFVREEAEPEYSEELEGPRPGGEGSGRDVDELYDRAVEVILQTQRGSATLLQRRLGIGYSRASRLVDRMAEEGIVGPYKGSKAREVYYTLEEWEAMRGRRP